MNAVDIVRERFPKVEKVIDSKRAITITVTDKDTTSAKVKNHKECAMAVACKRQMKSVSGVMISLKTAYVIKGTKAYRFTVPEAVSREVVSFDRKAGFAPGEYQLRPPAPATRLGARSGREYTENRQHKATGKGMAKRFSHTTSDVRTKLGGKEYRAETE